MNRPRLALLAPHAPRHAALGVALALGAPGVAAAQGAPPPAPIAQVAQTADAAARARDLFKKGRQEFDQGHLGAAYESYLAAWDLQKSYDIAGNLASLEMETARYRGAAEHAAYALANLPTSSTDAQRGFLDKVLKDAKKQIVTVTIRVDVERAAITVDGHPIGESPLRGEVYVDAGDHVIAATAPDHAPAQDKLHAERGATSLIMLTLPRLGGGSEGGGGPVSSPRSKLSSPSPLVIAGFITAGVAAGAGAGFAILSKGKADSAASKLAALTSSGHGLTACAGASPSADCVALHDARVSQSAFANVATWAFIGAGVVTAGTLVYTFVIPHGSGTSALKASRIQAAPIVSPEGGALLVRGTF